MNEEFLQYIWANSLFTNWEYKSADGKDVRILNVGKLNRDAGPDFFLAKIEIDSVILIGNVEIHCLASDWRLHGHNRDRTYDNVILSVVERYDEPIFNSRGDVVETIELEYSLSLWEEYRYLNGTVTTPRCSRHLKQIFPEWMEMVFTGYAIERLEQKCDRIRELLRLSINDWNSCFYKMILRYWAGNVNAEAFTHLSNLLPYKTILRNCDSLLKVEALLFGVSGLLVEAAEENDTYIDTLKDEYDYMASKYCLESMNISQWRFMRIRPSAFPTVRIALLAAFLFRSDYVFSTILNAESTMEAKKVLDVRASPYWDNHYQFGKTTEVRVKRVGESMKKVIIINAFIPLLFVYGRELREERYCEKAISWLEEIKAEENSITKCWKRHGVKINTALHSQAILQLKSEYCDRHRCLDCKIGNKIFQII